MSEETKPAAKADEPAAGAATTAPEAQEPRLTFAQLHAKPLAELALLAKKYRLERGGNIDYAGTGGDERDADPVVWTEFQLAFAVER